MDPDAATENSLAPAERLKLQQLLQIDFWKKRAGLDEDEKREPPAEGQGESGPPNKWSLTRGVVLHSWQKQCVDTWFNSGNKGVLKVVTGAGKTILALAIAEKLQQSRAQN